jgi:hypothetical protein
MTRRHLSFLAAGASLLALSATAEHASANPWIAAAPQSAGAAMCARPQGLPPVRRAGNLVVESPPRAKPERWLRLRTHQSPPGAGGISYWEGPEVPAFVPLTLGSMELDLLDPIAGGYLALYRSDAFGLGPNDAFEVRLFSCAGQTLAVVPLNPLMSRRDQLEVQDVRYADGTLYFNEACQSYSRDAGGRCSALVAVEPLTKRLLWRTHPLTSNNVFRIAGNYVIAGYGFTAESDWVRVVRRSDGRIMEREALASSHFALELRGNVLDVEIGGKWSSFRMDGFAGASPQLTPTGTRVAPAPSGAPAAHGAPSPAAVPWPTWTLPPTLPRFPAMPAPSAPRAAPAVPDLSWAAPWLPPGWAASPAR